MVLLVFCLFAVGLATYQQVSKITGNGAFDQCYYGGSVALSATGDVLAVGGPGDYYDPDDSFRGAVWMYTKSNGYWTQQGSKLVGSGAIGDTTDFGRSVALSKAGDVLAGGCPLDNGYTGAVWVFTQSNGVWTQQGSKLVGAGAVGTKTQQGISVSLSDQGDLLAVGGFGDNSAVWIWVQKNGVWSQQGDKLVGSGGVGVSYQGSSVALSSAGDTLVVGGYSDNAGVGAVWTFVQKSGVWSQQGSKLVGTGATGEQNQGISLSLSSDGNTLAVGGTIVDSVWIFKQNNGNWAQQGNRLVGTGANGTAGQGFSVSLSGAGDVLAVGGPYDNNNAGAVWVWTQTNGVWTQQGNKLVGGGAADPAYQGFAVALSNSGADYLADGGRYNQGGVGAVWMYQASNATGYFNGKRNYLN